jgi:hypothetical protein
MHLFDYLMGGYRYLLSTLLLLIFSLFFLFLGAEWLHYFFES